MQPSPDQNQEGCGADEPGPEACHQEESRIKGGTVDRPSATADGVDPEALAITAMQQLQQW
ncbi:MAG: hypothetical protein ACH34U_06460 [Cyanobium sp.]